MAGLSKRGKSYYVNFRYEGRQISGSLHTSNQEEAQRLRSRIEGLLDHLHKGVLTLPEGADLWEWLISDRTRTGKAASAETLEEIMRRYIDSPHLEKKTKKVITVYSNHLKRILGPAKRTIGLADLRNYLATRSRETYHGKPIDPVTIDKEIKALRTAWKLAGKSPLPQFLIKTQEKPPFRTWAETEEIVKKTGDPKYWDYVFLDLQQIQELLDYVKAHSEGYPLAVPIYTFLAHTGARISEALRSRVEDWDFQRGRVRIREKKKSRARYTTREVPISSQLRLVMEAHLKGYVGLFAFSTDGSEISQSASINMRLKVLRGSKWENLRGFHVLRHSFASVAAAAGIDERTIDSLMGHQTEEMRKRYRHLFPSQREGAIDRLFGEKQ